MSLFEIVQDNFSKRLEGMFTRGKQVQAWMDRVAYPLLINVQRKRWQTEGQSEGYGWKPISPSYAKLKLKKFADYEGGGRKMLIATNRLAQSMMGENQDHYKLVTENRLEMGSFVPYAKYVNEDRDIVTLSDETRADLLGQLRAYLMGGQ